MQKQPSFMYYSFFSELSMLFQQNTARFSKSICILFVVVLLQGAATQVSAQAPDSLTGMKGFWVNVGNSYSVAFKYWMSPKTAVVAGTSIVGSGSTANLRPLTTSFNPSVFGRFQYFLSERQQFMPYLSAGGNVGITWFWSQGDTNSSLNLGVNGGVGMECFILPWLSVAGELVLGGSYSLWRTEPVNPGINPSTFNSWSAGLGNSGIIFTIYF